MLAITIVLLVISLIFNGLLLFMMYKQNQNYDDLSNSYDELVGESSRKSIKISEIKSDKSKLEGKVSDMEVDIEKYNIIKPQMIRIRNNFYKNKRMSLIRKIMLEQIWKDIKLPKSYMSDLRKFATDKYVEQQKENNIKK